MDIAKHCRTESFQTKSIRYWSSQDITDFLRHSVSGVPTKDVEVYCARVEQEKCDGNCLLACEKLLQTNSSFSNVYLDLAYIQKYQLGWEKSPLQVKKDHVKAISSAFLHRYRQVVLRVYDVTGSLEGYQQTMVYTINQLARPWLGGAYHVGVEIFGVEYAFGQVGVYGHLPRKEVMNHHFRESLLLPCGEHEGRARNSTCTLSKASLAKLLYTDMAKEWKGSSYDLIHRNCCHFADDLCEKIGVGKIPRWINRVARAAATVDAQFSTIKASLTVPTTPPINSKDEKKDTVNNPNLVELANDMLKKGQISKTEYNLMLETQRRYSNSMVEETRKA